MAFKSTLHTLLSRDEAKLPMAALGVLVGISAGLFTNLFRLVLEGTFPLFLDGLGHDDFEALSPAWHFFLPVAGCVVIGQLLYYLAPDLRRMGVSYVIDKVQNFRTRMPVRNAVMQFVTASIALLSGGSCGREGPAIHLGASAGGAIGSALALPNNTIRTLIAAGSAAAIAAAFNTPIAGVIFAMEVILMEYAITGIIPVIVAAVSGDLVTRIFYGGESVFMIESMSLFSLWHIPYVALMGLVIGALASLFVTLHRKAVGFGHIDLRLRLLFTGLITGTAALLVPEIMGTGYDSLNAALAGNLPLAFLLVLLAVKLAVSAVGLGLGLPGGVIGPSLVLGGLAGGAMGIIGEQLAPGMSTSPAFYVLVGMCAMMGATLQAPLAALMALLELSYSPSLILPAMLIIVVANMTSSEIFHTRSVFQNTLEKKQSGFSPELSRFLSRYGISTVTNRKVQVIAPDAGSDEISRVLAAGPDWVIIDHEGDAKALISGSALALDMDDREINLQKLDAAVEILPFSYNATLLETLEILHERGHDYGYVQVPGETGLMEITGIVARDDIMAYYKGI